MSSARNDMTMRTIALAGSLLVLGMAHSAGLARAEERGDAISGTDPIQDDAGRVPIEALATDAKRVDEGNTPSEESTEPSTSDTDGGVGESAPGAAVEEELTHELDELTEQIAEQNTLLETAQTGEERIRIANHIRFLKQELHALQRALQ